jgi:peptidoglycan/LPS O-acetylase OafA/YrhL
MTATLERPAVQRASGSAQISRVPYLPGLDGLRALAVVAVIVYHANKEWLHGGFLGVEVFFVISGYLITLLLIGEHERHGDINLRQFWLRRFRRLLPALFVMMGLLAIYLAVGFTRARGQVRGDFLGGIFYGSNWYQIWVGQGYTAANAFVPLRHLWSLAVEEQFYLIWPLVMIAILRGGRERLPRVALWLFGIAVAVTIAVAVLFHPGDMATECGPDATAGYWNIAGRCISTNDALYLSTFTRSTGLLLGAAFAMVWRPMAIMRGPLRRRSGMLDLVGVVGIGLVAVMTWKIFLSDFGRDFGVRFDPWLFRGGLFFTGVATLMMIAAVTHRDSRLGRLLGNPVINWVGTRSYGLYLYHWPIFQIIRREAGAALSLGEFVGAMVIAGALTEASYRLVETPIRKGRFGEWLRGERTPRSSERRRPVVLAGAGLAALVGFATVSIAIAPNRCVGDIECSLVEAGSAADVVPSLPTPTSTQSSVDTTVAESTGPTSTLGAGETIPPTVATTTAVPTSTTPPPPAPPLAIGESVMAGAVAQLQAGGFQVNAAKSRGPSDTLNAVVAYRDAGFVGDVLVIQLGTNGRVSDESYDAVVAAVPPDTRVYFLTVFAPRDYTDGNNERISSLPSRYPNVQIIDWSQVAPTTALCSDLVHIACGGGAATAYANMIFDAVGIPRPG